MYGAISAKLKFIPAASELNVYYDRPKPILFLFFLSVKVLKLIIESRVKKNYSQLKVYLKKIHFTFTISITIFTFINV